MKRLANIALVACLAWTAADRAAACPHAGVLGTSRVLAVDAATSAPGGDETISADAAARDREVVFDLRHGPWPGTTPKVLAALSAQCVRATFFLIGKPASERPETGAPDRGRGPHHRDITPGAIAA